MDDDFDLDDYDLDDLEDDVDDDLDATDASVPPPPPAVGAADPAAGPLSRARTTWLLSALIAVLVLALGAMAGYRWAWAEPNPDRERPVMISEVSREAALAAAEAHTVAILSKNHAEYAEQTERALDLIVPDSAFAAEYERTADDLEAAFVEEEVDLDFVAVERGVVRAGPEEVQVLLYLNQYISRGTPAEESDEPLDFTPYRALVTVVPSGAGWRVLQIDTR